MAFTPAICPEDCVYLTSINGNLPMCGYLHITGELRGCDPGPGCKRYAGKPNRHDRFRTKKPTWDVETGRKMWAGGYTDAQIGKKLGVSRDTVARYRERNWGAINRQRQKKP